jgi:hypothetical protein
MSRLFAAFITTQPQPPVLFYAGFSEPRGVTRVALFVCQIVTLDFLLVGEPLPSVTCAQTMSAALPAIHHLGQELLGHCASRGNIALKCR